MSSILKYLLLLLIFVSSLGQFTRLPFGNGALYASEFVTMLIFTTWFFWRVLIVKKLKIMWIDISIVLVITVSLISLLLASQIYSLGSLITGLFYLIRLSVYLALLRIVIDLQQSNHGVREFIENVIIITTFIFSLIGLFQFLLFPDFSQYVQHGWDPHYYRVLSTFFDPNYAGLYITVGFLFLLNLWFNKPSAAKGIMLVLMLTAILLTFSRSTYVAFFTGMSIFSWFKDKRIIIGMIIIASLAFVSIPRVQERIIGAVTFDETTMLRFDDYSKTYDIFRNNMIFGVGFNVFREAQNKYGYFRNDRGVNASGGHAGAGADNMLLFIAATTGIIGLVAYAIFIATLGYVAIKSSQKALLLAILAAWILHAQFLNSFFFVWIMSIILIIFGIYFSEDHAEIHKTT